MYQSSFQTINPLTLNQSHNPIFGYRIQRFDYLVKRILEANLDVTANIFTRSELLEEVRKKRLERDQYLFVKITKEGIIKPIDSFSEDSIIIFSPFGSLSIRNPLKYQALLEDSESLFELPPSDLDQQLSSQWGIERRKLLKKALNLDFTGEENVLPRLHSKQYDLILRILDKQKEDNLLKTNQEWLDEAYRLYMRIYMSPIKDNSLDPVDQLLEIVSLIGIKAFEEIFAVHSIDELGLRKLDVIESYKRLAYHFTYGNMELCHKIITIINKESLFPENTLFNTIEAIGKIQCDVETFERVKQEIIEFKGEATINDYINLARKFFNGNLHSCYVSLSAMAKGYDLESNTLWSAIKIIGAIQSNVEILELLKQKITAFEVANINDYLELAQTYFDSNLGACYRTISAMVKGYGLEQNALWLTLERIGAIPASIEKFQKVRDELASYQSLEDIDFDIMATYTHLAEKYFYGNLESCYKTLSAIVKAYPIFVNNKAWLAFESVGIIPTDAKTLECIRKELKQFVYKCDIEDYIRFSQKYFNCSMFNAYHALSSIVKGYSLQTNGLWLALKCIGEIPTDVTTFIKIRNYILSFAGNLDNDQVIMNQYIYLSQFFNGSLLACHKALSALLKAYPSLMSNKLLLNIKMITQTEA